MRRLSQSLPVGTSLLRIDPRPSIRKHILFSALKLFTHI